LAGGFKGQRLMKDCPFCYDNIKDRIIAEQNSIVAIPDSYPVTHGHLLIIPKRHMEDYFSMDETEKKGHRCPDYEIKKPHHGTRSFRHRLQPGNQYRRIRRTDFFSRAHTFNTPAKRWYAKSSRWGKRRHSRKNVILRKDKISIRMRLINLRWHRI